MEPPKAGTKRKVCEREGGAPKDRALKVRENEERRLRAVTVGKAWHPARWDVVLGLITSLEPLGKRLRSFAQLFYKDKELRDSRAIALLEDVLEAFIGIPDCNFRNIECHAFLGVAKNIGMVCDCDKDGNPIDWRRGRFEFTDELVVRAYWYALSFNGAFNKAGFVRGSELPDGEDGLLESFWLVEDALDIVYMAAKRMRVIDMDTCDADICPTESDETGGSDPVGLGAQPEAEPAPALVREAPGTPDAKVPVAVAAESVVAQGQAEKKRKKKKGKGAAGTRAPTEVPVAPAAAASAAPTEVPVASAAAASVAPIEVPPAAAAAVPTEVPVASQAPPSAEAGASEDTEMTAAADHAKQHQIDSNDQRKPLLATWARRGSAVPVGRSRAATPSGRGSQDRRGARQQRPG